MRRKLGFKVNRISVSCEGMEGITPFVGKGLILNLMRKWVRTYVKFRVSKERFEEEMFSNKDCGVIDGLYDRKPFIDKGSSAWVIVNGEK